MKVIPIELRVYREITLSLPMTWMVMCSEMNSLRTLGMNFEFQVSFYEIYKSGCIIFNNRLKTYSKSFHFK